jgi:hypothetical protein
MSRLRWIPAGVAVLVAAGLEVLPQQGPRAPFEIRHVVAHGQRIDTQFYDFTGDGLMDALVVSIDWDVEPRVRWLALHIGKKGEGIPEKPDQIWPAAPFACALALANVVPEGGVDILEIAPDGVYYHAFERGVMTEEPRKLIHTRTFFTTPSDRSLPLWAKPVDLSKDGLDDLVLPVSEGYKVYFQTAPGRFGTVVRLEADLPAGRTPAISPRRFAVDWERSLARGLPPSSSLFNLHDELPRITPVDINGDGLLDLVSIRGDEMTIFFQKAGLQFPAAMRKTQKIATLREERRKDKVDVADVQFCDLNGDGIMDFVVTKIEGQLGLLKSIRTRIYPHLGTGRGNFQGDTCIFVDGVSLNPVFLDMNGDGALDVLTSRLRTDILEQAVSVMAFGDITVTYEVFQFDKVQNSYSNAPVFSFDVRIPIEDMKNMGAGSRPLFQVARDMSGDGRPDAVIYDPKTSSVEVRRGRPVWEAGGGRQVIGFEKDVAASFVIEKKNPPKWMSFLDIDGDGRQDVILDYNGLVKILLSRF